MMMEISVNPASTSILLRKLAFFGSSLLGNDIYYMKEFIDLLINIVGEDKLIGLLINDTSNNRTRNNEIGRNWNKPNGMKSKLRNFDKIIERTKSA